VPAPPDSDGNDVPPRSASAVREALLRNRRLIVQVDDASSLGLVRQEDATNYIATLPTLTVTKLKDRLRILQLPLGGRKADLVQRLSDHIVKHPSAVTLLPEADRPLTPWSQSSARQRIIDDLTNGSSAIHLIADEKIHQDYAPRYNAKYVQKLLDQFRAKTGPFKNNSNGEVEPWKSRKGKSKASSLLEKLLMNPEKYHINEKNVDEIYCCSTHFQQYPIEDFRKYYEEMVEITNNKKAIRDEEEAAYARHMIAFPRNSVTDRGKPYFDTSSAKTFLEEDVRNNVTNEMTPAVLRETREEYKEFSPKSFGKFVQQIKKKQRCKSFWQQTRKKIALREREKEIESMAEEWVDRERRREVDKLAEEFMLASSIE
jgi:hypothetical protein